MADWTNTCQVCGAEEGLDVLIMRMIDDDTVRRLIHDTLKLSLPLGAQLTRYIRLHNAAQAAAAHRPACRSCSPSW